MTEKTIDVQEAAKIRFPHANIATIPRAMRERWLECVVPHVLRMGFVLYAPCPTCGGTGRQSPRDSGCYGCAGSGRLRVVDGGKP